MTQAEETRLINELLSIEASADVLKERSYRLRKRLEERGGTSSPRKGKGLSEAQKAGLLAKRKSRINKAL